MNPHSKPTSANESIGEDEVVRFLREHPDFFTRHATLLDILRIPHPVRGAISLLECQLDRLRERNRQLERNLSGLIQRARENERLSAHLHHLALGLLRADGIDSILATIRESLRQELHADFVAMRLIDHEGTLQAPYALPPQAPELTEFDSLFASHRPACGPLIPSQAGFLFGEHTQDIASAAVIPLQDTRPLGLLAIGSRDPNRFQTGMGTLFLGYLRDLVATAISVELGRG